MPTKAFFYRTENNKAKIQWITQQAHAAYRQEKRLLITVPNLQAAHYIDDLLWKIPADSFLPHVVTDMPTVEWIAITLQEQSNINQAFRLLNLCPHPTPLFHAIEEIYELLDETTPEKASLSQQKLRFYQEKGVLIA